MLIYQACSNCSVICLWPSHGPATHQQAPEKAHPCSPKQSLTPHPSPTKLISQSAGFAEAVKAANSSPLGRRNGCAVLSMQGSEKALLQHLLTRLHALRPDVLVGHNLGAGDLPLLLQRLQHHKVLASPGAVGLL